MKFVIPDDPKVEVKENGKTELSTATKKRTFTVEEVVELLSMVGKERENGQ